MAPLLIRVAVKVIVSRVAKRVIMPSTAHAPTLDDPIVANDIDMSSLTELYHGDFPSGFGSQSGGYA